MIESAININIGAGWLCVASTGAKAAVSLAPKLQIPSTEVDILGSKILPCEIYSV